MYLHIAKYFVHYRPPPISPTIVSSIGAANSSTHGSVYVDSVILSIVLGEKWSWQVFTESSHLGLGMLQRIGQEIDGLIRSNGKFLMSSKCRIPLLDFRGLAAFTAGMVVAACILQLAEAR